MNNVHFSVDASTPEALIYTDEIPAIPPWIPLFVSLTGGLPRRKLFAVFS